MEEAKGGVRPFRATGGDGHLPFSCRSIFCNAIALPLQQQLFLPSVLLQRYPSSGNIALANENVGRGISRLVEAVDAYSAEDASDLLDDTVLV